MGACALPVLCSHQTILKKASTMARTSLASLASFASIMRARARACRSAAIGSAIAYRAATAVGGNQRCGCALQEQFTPNLVQKLLSQQEARSARARARRPPACGRNGGKCCRSAFAALLRLPVRSPTGRVVESGPAWIRFAVRAAAASLLTWKTMHARE